MKKTLYVTDLDGTLLNPQAELSATSARILNELIGRGLHFTYATARSLKTAAQVTAALDLRLPVVAYNGAFIFDPKTGEALERCMLDGTRMEPMLRAMRDARLAPLIYAYVDGAERVSWLEGQETSGIEAYLAARRGDERLRPVRSYDALFAGELFYVTLIDTCEAIYGAEPIFQGHEHVRYFIQEDTYHREEFWLEIYRHDATKDQGMLKVKQHIGAEAAVCFGDNINDLPMLRAADRGCAVANARPQVLKAAAEIIGLNSEDGVARWLQANALLDPDAGVR